ncbi:hypothetical protein PILCRDRAFT_822511 [Piloderma croceum F 1598]|uniref:Type 1 phosphatases regulator n=1 Tax=Piloderma croceum (strain F 1598) TaxID=765440 RepID=A0A0C3F6S5_PILCF|nr:hypothetical protein PILCRDRAFT_822511 [Piloderma croceum F 1598]
MASAIQLRPSASAPPDGSRTITIQDVQPRLEGEGDSSPTSSRSPIGALRLRGGPRRTRQRVAWDDGVVDNEGAGKKKSKICCIYHKPRRFDESSDEDSSDSESESDCDHGHNHYHTHSRGRPGEGSPRNHEEGGGVIHGLEENPEPNAYEVAPGSKKGKRKTA